MAHPKFYLAACCIIKDEEPFMEEWFTYHQLIGVEHFFVYDNFSTPPLEENSFVQKLAAAGLLTLTPIAGRAMQLPAYAHCLQNYGTQCQWLAFIDLDEFICPLLHEDMRLLLVEYEDFSCLALSWKCFGSSGFLSRPPGLVLRNYQERFERLHPVHLHIKSVVQPARTANVHTAHAFFPHRREKAVNEHFRPLPFGGSLMPVSWDKACINHYMLKSQQDAERRIQRGRADVLSDKATVDYADFYRLVQEKQEKDEAVLRFLPALEERLYSDAALRPEPPLGAPGPAMPPEDSELKVYTRLAGLCMHDRRFSEAELLLCRAGLRYAHLAELWVVRASLARRQGQRERAGRFLKKAFSLNELPQCYEELLDLLLQSDRQDEAKAVLAFLLYASTVRTSSADLNHKLELAKKILRYKDL
ncbi:MAG: glycosyltransferase family 92 protein [Deltaproteobacteria bacterium]|jgi:hypothetical protein|nr:glycosyltransferase family 92 protein [Deltaproteobacteria bacterium]